ncbi:hypothetical protein FOCC_FOCC001526 [Frankliniella occidentalis]|uniref:Uncharacterized protein LOC113216298 n=1 Tax=Frankliniella occidentalis TaxID=133901 RepID=A0A9C6XDF1_FRAOC|nr:uncharacterized protein LOC113216298 [Frankliniella occidentalis]KAE8751678.1 hypothetical protein FOCC_FOCC001526 [Frankliniella occidentalis]
MSNVKPSVEDGGGEVELELRLALTEWGFPDLIPHFTRHEIKYDAFLTLSAEDLRYILPYGKVLKFSFVYEREIVALRQPKPSSSDTQKPDVDPSTSKDSSVELESTVFNSDEEEENSEELVTEVKKVLSLTFQGQVLLATKSDDLKNEDRDRIAELVICEELRKSESKLIDSKRLLSLAKGVAGAIDGESYITYYTPHKRIDGQVFQARGKFCTQVQSWRKRGMEVGLVSKIHSYKKPRTSSPDCVVPQDAVVAVDWLKVNLGPFSTAALHWKSSYEYRVQLFESFDEDCIERYLNTFPILRQPTGLELVSRFTFLGHTN